MQSHSLELLFPILATSGYSRTSEPTEEYNCIAWAAGDAENWWWPSPDSDLSYWPAGIPRERTVECFVQAFETLGYRVCKTSDLEAGFEKVAIYVNDNGLPTHAARQLRTGSWTSKLGSLEDIDHLTLAEITGKEYGNVSILLKRPAAH